MAWQRRILKIEVGSRVCYSANFLRATGQYTGEIPAARGVVTELKDYGNGFVLATVDWSNPDIPERVAVANLSRVTEKGILD